MTLWLNWPGSRPMAGVHLSRRGEEPGEHVGQATGIEGKVLRQTRILQAARGLGQRPEARVQAEAHLWERDSGLGQEGRAFVSTFLLSASVSISAKWGCDISLSV